jgi:hypothetical protein
MSLAGVALLASGGLVSAGLPVLACVPALIWAMSGRRAAGASVLSGLCVLVGLAGFHAFDAVPPPLAFGQGGLAFAAVFAVMFIKKKFKQWVSKNSATPRHYIFFIILRQVFLLER